MSWHIPDMGTMVSWIFHVPDTYEMLWWLMICICWFGIVTEFRLKKLQKQLDEMQDKERPASER
jgi:hypothetical protein